MVGPQGVDGDQEDAARRRAPAPLATQPRAAPRRRPRGRNESGQAAHRGGGSHSGERVESYGVVTSASAGRSHYADTMPPLRVHPTTPASSPHGGRAVYLTGSHHWDVLVDNGERPGGFDFEGYLDRLEAWGHNFIRLWAHEAWTHDLHPRHPPHRPWLAADGRPASTSTRFNPEYFARLRAARRSGAGERGFYVIVMLFNGWSIHDNGEGNPWDRHPFNRRNNVNGIDGDPDARGDGSDVHTLRVPAVTRLQEAYVGEGRGDGGRPGPRPLGDLQREPRRVSRDWQYHLIRHLRSDADAGRHPIGMTACFPGNRNEDLFGSPADWVSPATTAAAGGARRRPRTAARWCSLDTDHLWGIGGGATGSGRPSYAATIPSTWTRSTPIRSARRPAAPWETPAASRRGSTSRGWSFAVRELPRGREGDGGLSAPRTREDLV